MPWEGAGLERWAAAGSGSRLLLLWMAAGQKQRWSLCGCCLLLLCSLSPKPAGPATHCSCTTTMPSLQVAEYGDKMEVAYTLAEKVLTSPSQEVALLGVNEVRGGVKGRLARRYGAAETGRREGQDRHLPATLFGSLQCACCGAEIDKGSAAQAAQLPMPLLPRPCPVAARH